MISRNDAQTVASPLLVSLKERLTSSPTANQNGTACLVLASQSPRRREILDMMGLAGKYSCEPPPLDESALQVELVKQNLHPSQYTRRLAEAKAHSLATAHSIEQGTRSIPIFYLGSDTVVDIDDRILEKPRDENEAKSMLRTLSGREHQVHTGVAGYRLSPDSDISLAFSFTESAHVTFANLTDADIDAYIASGEPMDKAGSYGIQGIGGQMVEQIAGDFFTVMGLPMHQTSKHLAEAIAKEYDQN
eukprot:scaffold7017_cov134-Cylindrotheca_fusiformis.AAC.4